MCCLETRRDGLWALEEVGKKAEGYKKKHAVRIRFPILSQGSKESQKFQPRGVRIGSRPLNHESHLRHVPRTPFSSLFPPLANRDCTRPTRFSPPWNWFSLGAWPSCSPLLCHSLRIQVCHPGLHDGRSEVNKQTSQQKPQTKLLHRPECWVRC